MLYTCYLAAVLVAAVLVAEVLVAEVLVAEVLVAAVLVAEVLVAEVLVAAVLVAVRQKQPGLIHSFRPGACHWSGNTQTMWTLQTKSESYWTPSCRRHALS